MVSLLILSLGLFSILDRAELKSLYLEARSVLKDSNPEIQIDRHGIKWKLCPFCDFRFPCDQGEDVLLFHVASGHMQNDDEFMATYDRVGRDESKIVLKEGTFHFSFLNKCICVWSQHGRLPRIPSCSQSAGMISAKLSGSCS